MLFSHITADYRSFVLLHTKRRIELAKESNAIYEEIHRECSLIRIACILKTITSLRKQQYGGRELPLQILKVLGISFIISFILIYFSCFFLK